MATTGRPDDPDVSVSTVEAELREVMKAGERLETVGGAEGEQTDPSEDDLVT